MENANKFKKKKYEKPAIIFEKKIETLAAICDSQWLGELPCMKTIDTCAQTTA